MTLECELVKDVLLDCELDTGEAKSQSKTVTPTAEPQTVYPDASYLLSSVHLTEPLSQEKTVTSAVNQQTVTPDEGYLLSSVTVEGMPTETATATPTEQTQTVVPSEGKLLSEVSVEPIPSQYKNTSDADVTAEDITQGKIGYGVNGRIVGTNDFVRPTKGFTLDFDSNGRVTKVTIIGFTNDMPSNYLNNVITASNAFNNAEVVVGGSVTLTPNNLCPFAGGLVKFTVKGHLTKTSTNTVANGGKLKTVIFENQVDYISTSSFYSCNAVTLYDFTGCSSVPELQSAGAFSFASGCVFRVPASLLNDWKAADGWKDLPTDTSLSKYMVWEGV